MSSPRAPRKSSSATSSRLELRVRRYGARRARSSAHSPWAAQLQRQNGAYYIDGAGDARRRSQPASSSKTASTPPSSSPPAHRSKTSSSNSPARPPTMRNALRAEFYKVYRRRMTYILLGGRRRPRPAVLHHPLAARPRRAPARRHPLVRRLARAPRRPRPSRTSCPTASLSNASSPRSSASSSRAPSWATNTTGGRSASSPRRGVKRWHFLLAKLVVGIAFTVVTVACLLRRRDARQRSGSAISTTSPYGAFTLARIGDVFASLAPHVVRHPPVRADGAALRHPVAFRRPGRGRRRSASSSSKASSRACSQRPTASSPTSPMRSSTSTATPSCAQRLSRRSGPMTAAALSRIPTGGPPDGARFSSSPHGWSSSASPPSGASSTATSRSNSAALGSLECE